ncbi:hypothetical protein PENTCL1PPCAC_22187, partial [Pristionchus entomophagus]
MWHVLFKLILILALQMSLSRHALLPSLSPMMTRGRKRKLEEEYRNTFPILKFPNEIIFKIYPHLDLASRRAMRVNGRLADIEMEIKYLHRNLDITLDEWCVILECEGAKMNIPRAEIEKEFELLGENTYFKKVTYIDTESERLDDTIVSAMRFLKAKKLTFMASDLSDNELYSIVQNKKSMLCVESNVTESGYMWIYEKMRDRQLDLNHLLMDSNSVEERWSFMEKLGNFNRDTRLFSATNPQSDEPSKMAVLEPSQRSGKTVLNHHLNTGGKQFNIGEYK